MIANETTLHKRPHDTEMSHRAAFNNERIPYRIISYKRPLNDNVKQFKRKNKRPNICTKNERKTNMEHINNRQPLNYRLLT